MLKIITLACLFLIVCSNEASGQEKFLEIELRPQLFDGSKVKDYIIHVAPLEGGNFKLPIKRKRAVFFLTSGERYTLAVEKEGFHPMYYTVDLRNIPEELNKDNKYKLALAPYLHPKSSDRPVPHIKYHFSDRYKKVVIAPDEVN